MDTCSFFIAKKGRGELIQQLHKPLVFLPVKLCLTLLFKLCLYLYKNCLILLNSVSTSCKKWVNEEGFRLDQISKFGENRVFQKKMLSKAYISKKIILWDYKEVNSELTVMFGANTGES